MSYEAEAATIAAIFRARLAGLRRRLRPSEIPAAIRVLKDERKAALRAMKARRADERQAERRRWRGPKPPALGP